MKAHSHRHRLDVIRKREARDAGGARVRARAAELGRRDLLVRHRLHHLGPGDEHVRRLLDHHRKVGHRRRVDRAARARPHDDRDLRDDARRLDVALEDVGIPGERGDALLDPRAARIVEADHRRAELDGAVHHLADLLGVRLGERAAEDGEVLREDEDATPVHRAVARHDAVARRPVVLHPEVDAAVRLQHVKLAERAVVEEERQPLARRQLPVAVLLCLLYTSPSPRDKRQPRMPSSA